METSLLIFIPFIFAFLLSFLLTPISISFAKRFNLIDDPQKNKHIKVIHTKPTPRAGVIGISTTLILSCLLFLPLDAHVQAILLGVILLTVLGVLDDKYNLHPYTRLFVMSIAALLPIVSGIGIAYITNPFGGIIDLSHPQISFFLLGQMRTIWIISDLFAFVWIVSLMNFVNLGAKGVPGQLSGVVGIAAIIVALLSLQFSADITEWPVIILASILSGSYVGFLPWHIFPQRIMPGFGGSTVAGYVLAILAILTTTKVGTLLVVMGVPFIDTTYIIIRRIFEGKSPVWGDNTHLHHKLMRLGLTQEQTAFVYWGATAILGAIALNLHAADKLYTILGVTICLGGFFLWFKTRLK